MKINKLITCISGVVLSITMNSCDDITSENNTTSASFSTFNELKTQRLPGIYASLRSNALYRQGGLLGTWSDVGVDTHSGTLFPVEYNPLYSYDYEAGTLLIGQTWTEFYIAIKQINAFLGQIDEFSPESKDANPVIAEALFLRGMLYFDMVKIWGDIPIILSKNIDENTALDTVKSDANVANSSAEEVYLQIIKDLEFAMNNGNSRIGSSADIASKEAAQALLGKVYLQMTTTKEYGGVEGGIDENGNPVSRLKRFEQAEELFSDIIKSGSFVLEAEYADVFADETNNEVIFSVGYDGPNSNVGSDFGDFLGEGNLRDGGSFGAYRANVNFALEYLRNDPGFITDNILNPDMNGNGLPLPFVDNANQDKVFMTADALNFVDEVRLIGVDNFVSDKRFVHNIARKNFDAIAQVARGTSESNPLKDLTDRNLDTNRWSPFKYIKPLPNPNPGGDGTIDFPFLRYADVLLMEAEALVALGQDDKAREYVNMVISRSLNQFKLERIPDLIDPDKGSGDSENRIVYTLPTSSEAGTSRIILDNAVTNNRVQVDRDAFLVPDTIIGDQLLDRILLERNKELCYEGKRKDDLIRTGKLEEVISKLHANSVNSGSANQLPVRAAFNLERHTHWPIPQEQISLNPNLKQNCLYGGGNATAGCFDL